MLQTGVTKNKVAPLPLLNPCDWLTTGLSAAIWCKYWQPFSLTHQSASSAVCVVVNKLYMLSNRPRSLRLPLQPLISLSKLSFCYRTPSNLWNFLFSVKISLTPSLPNWSCLVLLFSRTGSWQYTVINRANYITDKSRPSLKYHYWSSLSFFAFARPAFRYY